MNTHLDAAIEAMSALLAEENAALTAMDFARAGALLAPKHAAADALAAAWRTASSGPPPQLALQHLGALADENRKLLNRAMRVQRRVLELVARAARGNSPTNRYGANGRASGGDSSRGLGTRA